jgi:hypothetical protein
VDYYGCAGQELILDDSALSCALDALSARTSGWFDISLQHTPMGYCGFHGCSWDVWRVEVLRDSEQVTVANCYTRAEEPDFNNTVRDLESPAYFENCKSLPSAAAKLDCLFEGMQHRAFVECD